MKFFGNLRSTSETVQTRFREIFYDFFKFGKFSEVFGIHRKICGQDRNCSETFAEDETEYRIWFWEVLKRTPTKLLRVSYDEKVEWNTTRCIRYYPLNTAEYATVFLASDWLYFLWPGIKMDILQRGINNWVPDSRNPPGDDTPM